MVNHKLMAYAISHNINTLCQTKMYAKKNLAELCNVSPALVTKWTKTDSPTIPRIEYLVTIADYFDVDVQWLITEHRDYRLSERIRTYSDALISLLSLTQKQIIKIDTIEDPILSYLVERYWDIVNDGVNDAEIKKWLGKIIKDFNIPITDSHNNTMLLEDILQREDGIASVYADDKYLNLAKALNDPEVLKRVHGAVGGLV